MRPADGYRSAIYLCFYAKSEYVREEDWGRVRAAVARREPAKEELNGLHREQTRLEQAARILDANLYRTFMFLKQCAEMDALPMEKRRDALAFARAMTALEGLAAKEETEQNLLLWARGEKKFKDIVFKIVRITAAIWQTHPFREGNTRSVVAFSVLLASRLGVKLDYELFASHAAYFRNALVWCTQGIYSIYDYLERIYFDAAGLLDDQPKQTAAKQKDYSVIEGYKVADYKEQPHTYMEE